jgi:hypothetical protein
MMLDELAYTKTTSGGSFSYYANNIKLGVGNSGIRIAPGKEATDQAKAKADILNLVGFSCYILSEKTRERVADSINYHIKEMETMIETENRAAQRDLE